MHIVTLRHTWPTSAFCAVRDVFWNFQKINNYVFDYYSPMFKVPTQRIKTKWMKNICKALCSYYFVRFIDLIIMVLKVLMMRPSRYIKIGHLVLRAI